MNPTRAMQAAALAISRRPVLTLLLLAAALAPLLAASARVRPDNSLASWFVEGDPALLAYQSFLREYGNDEAVLVGFATPGGARSAAERALQARIADRLARIDGIARVVNGGALPPPMSAGLVAADDSATAVVAWLEVRDDIEQARSRIIADVRGAARAELDPLGREAHLAGTGVLYDGLNAQTVKDTGVFLTLAIVVMIALLAAGLRSLRAVVLALVGPLLASAAGIGVLGLAGRPFTVVGSALPTLILVIALADAIHVLLHYERVRRDSPPADADARRRQAAEAVGWVALPCLFTALTTAGGFLALGTSRIALVRDFGIYAAIGMMLAWAVTLVFLAAALSLWDVPPPRRRTGGLIERALARYGSAVPRVRWIVIGAALVIAAGLGAGAARMETDTDTIGLLPRDHPVRQDSDWIEVRLGAYTPLEMRVSNVAGDVRDPAFLARVQAWRARAAQVPGVERTVSAIDFAAGPDAPLDGYVSADGRSLRVTAYVPMMSAKGLARAAAALEQEGERVFQRTGAVEATGYLPLYVRISDYVVQSTVDGLASSFILVFVLMALLIRTPLGLAAALPVNALPVLLVFGAMGWLGIPLDIATATVGAIVLGIVVDDTIHFLHRYRHERDAGLAPGPASVTSLREAGQSIVLTSVVLACGFAVMTAAGTRSIAYFGLVATLAIAGAMLADLLLLPALLSFGRSHGTDSRREGPRYGTAGFAAARPATPDTRAEAQNAG